MILFGVEVDLSRELSISDIPGWLSWANAVAWQGVRDEMWC